jgi:hypothetical protein
MDTLDQSSVPTVFITIGASVPQLFLFVGLFPVVSLLPVIAILALIVSDHHRHKKKKKRDQERNLRSRPDDTSEG